MRLPGRGPTARSRRRGLLSFSTLVLGLLSWSPYYCDAQDASDYFVNELPGAPQPLLKMHAGHVEVTPEHHGNLFFWLFQNRHIGDRQRTVIWLNGGPGCSSMDGAMMEIGPYRVKGKQLEYNDGSWDEFANLLFVDNPVGTGFSYVDTDSYIHELQTMADQFIIFLEKWFDMFPEYQNDDLYIAGESYAGEHIPYIAKTILERNDKTMTGKWNLKGLLIGNGWISPKDQYSSYLKFAYKRGLISKGSDTATRLEAQQAICDKKLAEPNGEERVDIGECEAILSELLRSTRDLHKGKDQECINMYDIRLRDSFGSCGMNWPPDLVDVKPYLREPQLVRALHINSDKTTGWSECSGAVSGTFTARKSKPAIDFLPGILEKVPIVLFSGDQDLICNHIGTEELIHNMEWNGGKGFELSPGTWAPRRAWTFEGEPAGIYQEARNLTYVLFYNASHMVPFDYPRRTRDMLDRFMGVDIASIGGKPSDSRIDGEKGVQTSVGGHPNSTAAEADQQKKLEEATRNAYYKSGEVALVLVIIAAGIWGWFVYRDRKKRSGYRGVSTEPGPGDVLDALRGRRGKSDVEAADFDESQLDRIDPRRKREPVLAGTERYSLGSLESDDEDTARAANGQANGGTRR